jgi:putative phage-type endonuclease
MDKKTIQEKDILEIINESELLIYENVKKENLLDDLIQEIKDQILSYYDITDQDNNLTVSKKYYINQYTEEIVEKKVDECRERLFNLQNISEKMENLKKLKLPEQRSKEWFEMRNNILTASSLADALGKGHFTTRDNLLIDKTSTVKKPFFTNDIIQWGVKYEPTATTFYEKLNELTVVEFGLVPHPVLKIFGASPDGICDIDSPGDYPGRMLEIKCPPKRKFTEEVPLHYWMQMQGQLETCDLEECDFLQVKFLEYYSEQDYIDDKLICYNEEEKIGYSSTGYPKGLVLTFLSKNANNETVYEYEYPEFYLPFDQLKIWALEIIKNYENKKCIYNWWKIERYECTLVLRDREWWMETTPKIIEFWEEVEFYRENGNQELIDKKEKRKRKKKPPTKNPSTKKETNIQINKDILNSIKNDYLLDSDSD